MAFWLCREDPLIDEEKERMAKRMRALVRAPTIVAALRTIARVTHQACRVVPFRRALIQRTLRKHGASELRSTHEL